LNQRINLYRGILRPQRTPLSAGWLLVAGLVAVAALVGVYAFLSWRLEQRQAELAELERQRDQVTSQVAELGNRLEAREVNPELAERAQALERELTVKRRLTSLLAGKAEGNVTGFSSLLVPLARHHVSGLWLRQIALRQGGQELALQGRTLDAAKVPDYLQALREAAAYQGRRFGTFRMQRFPDGPGLGFIIATRCGEAASNGPLERVAACLDGGD